ncbi:23S rRNA (cytidine1920-2'-O)/16S rRNA (cytidine1409-2'-O)-methyltransferase [Roseimicrobium gellanilyticum]|uniref:23S rRNA (Cytidine1920-2'-O)/16S rRNA (Cytidine1409-2'-O)-methyltransferase n=1 Tax=Roseimicrobium gellanilyticum TaxID=748857 RepID=A0A366HQ88_9BACT|nr:TlyA family RNA methyltransferase [Roseimicrobium gellanilyticum]RBP45274.1 23S rRNA (cytidine1920-2'-O)/16S rRNA (cytidine1409-2'-O)-methyltransferase [Roseimicrobium gellanilyticum]
MKQRLDHLLVARGLCESREKGKRLILAGDVLVNDEPITKAGHLVPEDAEIRIKAQPKYVSRGGFKMEGALEHFGIDVTGKTCLDVGASTGGFTDCLLQRGAVKVHAFDVGTNQLVWKLRNDPRVVSRENYNVRHLNKEDVPDPVDLIVADVSFISLTLVLPPAFQTLKSGGQAVVLIKPQFELSKEEIGKGGIVREKALHEKACKKIEDFARSQSGWEWRGLMESPIQGTDGNREFLAWIGYNA